MGGTYTHIHAYSAKAKTRDKRKGRRSWEALEASLTQHVTRKGQP